MSPAARAARIVAAGWLIFGVGWAIKTGSFAPLIFTGGVAWIFLAAF